jgi:hypothetical protein
LTCELGLTVGLKFIDIESDVFSLMNDRFSIVATILDGIEITKKSFVIYPQILSNYSEIIPILISSIVNSHQRKSHFVSPEEKTYTVGWDLQLRY